MNFDVGSLNNDIDILEQMYTRITLLNHSIIHYFDLSKTKFLGPYDVIGLVTCARLISQQQEHPVQLVDVNANILQYLTRVNVFTTASQWLLLPEMPLQANNISTRHSDHLLELTAIRQETDIFDIVQRVGQICLPLQVANLEKILRILSELCQNAFEHSGDNHSIVMVQRYLRPARANPKCRLPLATWARGGAPKFDRLLWPVCCHHTPLFASGVERQIGVYIGARWWAQQMG